MGPSAGVGSVCLARAGSTCCRKGSIVRKTRRNRLPAPTAAYRDPLRTEWSILSTLGPRDRSAGTEKSGFPPVARPQAGHLPGSSAADGREDAQLFASLKRLRKLCGAVVHKNNSGLLGRHSQLAEQLLNCLPWFDIDFDRRGPTDMAPQRSIQIDFDPDHFRYV